MVSYDQHDILPHSNYALWCVQSVRHDLHAGQLAACMADVDYSYSPCHHSNTYSCSQIMTYIGLGIYFVFHFAFCITGRMYQNLVPYAAARCASLCSQTSITHELYSARCHATGP